MKYLVITDIHGNLEALNTLLINEGLITNSSPLEINKEEAAKLLVLGDIIGYGPYPEECLNLIRKLTNYVIVGNHEEAFRNPNIVNRFNSMAKESYLLTKEMISEDSINYLKGLTYTLVKDEVFLAHGTPFKPEEFNYLRQGDIGTVSPSLNFIALEKKGADICFIGHSHMPGIMAKKKDKFLKGEEKTSDEVIWLDYENEREVFLDPNSLYIVNPGSLGQPRNGIQNAQYCIYDDVNYSITMKTCPYDYMKTVEALKALRVSPIIWQRIERGL